MKKKLFTALALTLFLTISLSAQNEFTWVGGSPTGDFWDDPANWTGGPAGQYPLNSGGTWSTATFNGSATVLFRSSQNFFLRKLTINSGTVVLTSQSGAATRPQLNVEATSPSTNISMVIAAGATLQLSDNSTGFLLNNSYGTVEINGTLDIGGTSSSNATAGIYQHAGTSSLYVTNVNSGGKIVQSGAGSRINQTGANYLVFKSGSTYEHNRDNSPMGACNLNSGSTLLCKKTTAYNSSCVFGGDIIWNVAGQSGVLGDFTWGISSLANVFGGTLKMQAGHLRLTGSSYSGSSFGGIEVTGGSLDFRPTATSATTVGSINVSNGYFGVSGVAFGSSANMTLNLTGDLTQSGGTINLSTGTANGVINVSGNVNKTAGTLTETGTATGSRITFTGGNAQNMTLSGTNSNEVDFEINKSANDVTLLAPATLPDDLIFTARHISLGDNNLTVTNTATGGSSTSHVVTTGTGTLTLKSISSGGKLLPVGISTSSYDPAFIKNTTGTADFSVKVKAPNGTFSCTVSNPSAAFNREWDITSASSNATVELSPDASLGLLTGTSYVSHCVGGTWEQKTSSTGSTLPFSAVFTSFSPFIINGDGAIPVELIGVKAAVKGTKNVLSWQTATEVNSHYFDVERSANGVNNWASVGMIKAAGNSQIRRDYTFEDNTPLSISYYRLRLVDYNGKEEVSKIISLNRSNKLVINKLSPMPVHTEGVTIDLQTSNGDVILSVTNIAGQLVHTEKRSVSEGQNQIFLPLSHLAAGTYFLSVQNGQNKIIEKLIKQ
jgi:hypothetical protein